MGLATLVRDEEAGAARLVVVGEIDLDNAAEFGAALRELIGAPEMVLDLTEVTHFGSSAIDELLGARRRAEASGTRWLVRPSRIVRRVLEITMLDGTFVLTDPEPLSAA